MKIYHYQETTGQLLAEGIADQDPLDPGSWLIPAHATTVEPPDHVDGSTRHFMVAGWEYKEIPKPLESPEQAAQEPAAIKEEPAK